MYNFEVNDRVLLDTRLYGSIEAVIDGHDLEKTRFRLRDVNLIDADTQVKGFRYVFSNDINCASVLIPDSNSVNDSGIGSDNSSSDNDPLDGTTVHDLEILKNLSRSYRFVQSYDRSYAIAMDDLNAQEYIGFMAEDCEFRTKTLHIFAMSTPEHIYIFDILSFGKMPEDMKGILESKTVKKITFNCDRLGDSLKFHYNVILNGVFDIQLADAYVTKIKTGEYPTTLLTYEECVSKYLNIPSHIYIKKPMLPESGAVRPLSNNFKSQLAQNISFMQNVSMKLYNNIMGPLFSACDYRTNLIRLEEDMYEAGVKVNDKSTDDLIPAFEAHQI